MNSENHPLQCDGECCLNRGGGLVLPGAGKVNAEHISPARRRYLLLRRKAWKTKRNKLNGRWAA